MKLTKEEKETLETAEKLLEESELWTNPKEFKDLVKGYQREGVQWALRYFPWFNLLIWIAYVGVFYWQD